MTNVFRNQNGASHIVALVGVLVIAVVAFGGYRVLNATEPDQGSDTVVVSQNKVPAQLKSTADVKKADNALESTAIDTSVNPDTLNSDIDSLQ
jgi:hypothetical protein